MYKLIKIPKLELRRLYEKEKKTADQIANLYNTSRSTILRELNRTNIKIRSSRYIKLSKKILNNLYLKQKKSTREIAKLFNCSQITISRRLEEFKIPIRHLKIRKIKKRDLGNIKIKLSKNKIKYLYNKKLWSISKIAKYYKCSYITIWKRMKDFGIKTRTFSEANKLNNFPRKIKISKEELENLYIKKKIPTTRIAKLYNCSHQIILKKMKEFGIKSRKLYEAMVIYPKINFNNNPLEKAYIIGFRLGDLHICRTNKNGKIIRAECSSRVLAQLNLFKYLFQKYGYINEYEVLDPQGKKETRIYSNLNDSFNFLLKKKDEIELWILKNKKYFFAFLAGYIDAEGHININPKYRDFLTLASYDKNILYQAWLKLNLVGIKCPKPRISAKKGYTSKAKKHPCKKDFWSLSIHSKKSLLNLFRNLEPYLKHENKIRSMKISLNNIKSRNERFDYLRM